MALLVQILGLFIFSRNFRNIKFEGVDFKYENSFLNF